HVAVAHVAASARPPRDSRPHSGRTEGGGEVQSGPAALGCRWVAISASKEPGHGSDSNRRRRSTQEGPGRVRSRRHRESVGEGHRGRKGAPASLRGSGDPKAWRGGRSILHGPPDLLWSRGGTHVSAALPPNRQGP